MRKYIKWGVVALIALIAFFMFMARPSSADTLNYGCGSSGGYYCSGNASGFADGMGDAHRVVPMSTAGSFAINDAVCAGTAQFGSTQADAYALDRTEDRSFAQCALALGVIGQEVVLVAAPTGTTWGDFRGPSTAPDGKWIILVKAGSGALAPAQLIAEFDPDIAANVIFQEVPAESYDLTNILGTISFGDADGVMWVQRNNPLGDSMSLVNRTAGIDFVATGYQQYADGIEVGSRRKAPVYDVQSLPVEGSRLDLLAGNGRMMDLLVVNVLGIAHSGVDANVREQAKAVFSDQGTIAPNLTWTDSLLAAYASGIAAANEAWALVD